MLTKMPQYIPMRHGWPESASAVESGSHNTIKLAVSPVQISRCGSRNAANKLPVLCADPSQQSIHPRHPENEEKGIAGPRCQLQIARVKSACDPAGR